MSEELKDITDYKDALAYAESERRDIENHAIELAQALTDINNMAGEDCHVKESVSKVDALMREYADRPKW